MEFTDGKPKVTPLQEGDVFTAKQMESDAGKRLPKHKADLESVVVVTEGKITMNISGKEHLLEQGDTFLVPPDEWHQIRSETKFKAVHIMPKEIKFEFN